MPTVLSKPDIVHSRITYSKYTSTYNFYIVFC